MRLIDAEKFEVFDATCQITKGIRSGKTAAYFYGEDRCLHIALAC